MDPVLTTESCKTRDVTKLREAASRSKPLLHQTILLAASSSSLPAAWWGNCKRRLLVENLFRGTGHAGADKERYSHFPGSSHCVNSVLIDSFGSWLLPSSPGQGSGLGETCQRATTGPVCVNTQCPAGTAWGPQQPLSSGTEKHVTFSLHFKPCLLTG